MKPILNMLDDGGGIRHIRARWVIQSELELKSAAHFGGQSDSSVDMTVLRDKVSGNPLLPGTSLTGALRGYLADVLTGYATKKEAADVSRLWGGERSDPLGGQSPIIVFDCLGILPDRQGVEIRDGVAINAAAGVALAHHKYDFEVLPRNTRFPARFDLLVEEDSNEQELLDLLLTALGGLANGDIRMGLRRTRGLGKLKAMKWRAKRFDLCSEAGWLQWLCTDALTPLAGLAQDMESLEDCIRKELPDFIRTKREDQRKRLEIKLSLQCKGGLLVRAPGRSADAPDVFHLMSGGKSILPGTSLAGVIRHRALRIAKLVREKQEDADAWINSLFGMHAQDTTGRDGALFASRLRVSESMVRKGERMRPSRIRIDRFTQGVEKTALFDEEPEYGGAMNVTLELRNPKPGEIGLLLLTVKDLITGDLALGGSSAVGRGITQGAGSIICSADESIPLKADHSVPDPRINAWIEEFHNAPVQQSKEVLAQ